MKFLYILLLTSHTTWASQSNVKQVTHCSEQAKISIPTSTIKKLKNIHLNDFVNETKIHKKLGDKLLTPKEFIDTIDNAIEIHCKNLNQPNNNRNFTERSILYKTTIKNIILREIFKNSSDKEIKSFINKNIQTASPLSTISLFWDPSFAIK